MWSLTNIHFRSDNYWCIHSLTGRGSQIGSTFELSKCFPPLAPNSGCQIWGQISGRVPLSAVKKLQSKSLYVFNLPVMVLILKTIKFIHQVFTWKWLEIRHFKICKEIVLKYRSLTQIRQNKQSPEVGEHSVEIHEFYWRWQNFSVKMKSEIHDNGKFWLWFFRYLSSDSEFLLKKQNGLKIPNLNSILKVFKLLK